MLKRKYEQVELAEHRKDILLVFRRGGEGLEFEMWKRRKGKKSRFSDNS